MFCERDFCICLFELSLHLLVATNLLQCKNKTFILVLILKNNKIGL